MSTYGVVARGKREHLGGRQESTEIAGRALRVRERRGKGRLRHADHRDADTCQLANQSKHLRSRFDIERHDNALKGDSMRFRLVEPRDFVTCRSLLNPALGLSHRTLQQLPAIWRKLATSGTFSIVDDPLKPYPACIRGFGARACSSTMGLSTSSLGQERNYLDAALYERILRGSSPVLPPKQIAEANSGEGLNLVVLNFGLREYDLSKPATQRVVQMGSAAFYALHAGFRLKTILNEVFGMPAADYMKAGGFRLEIASSADASSNAASSAPYLFVLRRAWVQPGVIDTLSSLFYPPPPQIGFSPSEQRVLVHALLNESDAEIARRLGLSLDGVKKTWRRIYERVSLGTFPTSWPTPASRTGGRSSENAATCNQHVRAHPEEVRPTIRQSRMPPPRGS